MRVLHLLFKTIFSGEFAFVIFLIGAVFKESLPFELVDLTLLFLVVSILVFLKRLLIKPEIKKAVKLPFFWYLIIIFLFLISFIFSDSNVYGMDKLLRFIVVTGWAFFGSLFIIRDRKALKRLFDSFILVTVICALSLLLGGNQTASGFTGLGGDNYLGSARIFGMGSVMLLAYFLYGNFSKKSRFIILAALLICLIALASTGARMPAITAALILIFLAIKTIKFNRGKIVLRKGTFKLIGLISLMIVGVFTFRDAPVFQTTIRRLEVLFSESNGGSSAGERLQLIDSAFQMFKDNPIFGVGLGGFGINYTGMDQRAYPHNMFLEFLAETGIIGFALFLFIIIIAFSRIMKSFRETDYLLIAISSTFLFMFVNVMVSGDFNDNRTFFTFLGLSLMLPAFNEMKSDGQTKKIREERKTKRYKLVW